MSKIIALIENWIGADYEKNEQEVESADIIDRVLFELVENESSMLTLSAGDTSLFICCSHGHSTVTVALGDDRYFDMLNTKSCIGLLEFIECGQSVDLPANRSVSPEIARSIAREFINSGGSIEINKNWKFQD